MYSLFLGAAAVMFTLFQGSGLLSPKNTPGNALYRKQAEEDLKELYTILKTKSTQTWLTQGYREAQQKLPQVNSFMAYHFLLSYYVYGFKKPNMRLKTPYKPYAIGIPGFLIKQVGTDFMVTWRHETIKNLIPQGARLILCDNMRIDQALINLVNPYFPKDISHCEHSCNLLLLNMSNPFITPIKHVTFEHEQKQYTLPITWLWLTMDNFESTLTQADINASTFMNYMGLFSPEMVAGSPYDLPSKQATLYIAG